MTQLCVIVPALDAPRGGEVLAAALATAKVAAVIIASVDGETIAPAAALPLIAQAQKAGAAALIEGDARLARTLKADGVHLPWSADVVAAAVEAREILGQGGIVGADAGTSRHDGMELGEQGVDYVAFGQAAVADPVIDDEEIDLVTWWAGVFEVPVVALDVREATDAARLAAGDADFVCVRVAADGGGIDTLAACAAAVTRARAAPVA